MPAEFQGGCIAIGNFDGVHSGHLHMVRALLALAARQNARAIAVTFDPHPLQILRPQEAPPLLTTIATRSDLLRQAGVDDVFVLPASRELFRLTAKQFFENIVVGQLQARGVVEGPNFRFGCDRTGDTTELTRLCHDSGIAVRIVDLVQEDQNAVSSSRIRHCLQQGQLANACRMMGHPWQLEGRVTRGSERGRLLGFPTANLTDIPTVIPGHGVYAGRCAVQGSIYSAAVSIGPNPTFGDQAVKVECHLTGFSGDLYDRMLQIDLVSEIRPLRTFENAAALKSQIVEDLETCRRLTEATPLAR